MNDSSAPCTTLLKDCNSLTSVPAVTWRIFPFSPCSACNWLTRCERTHLMFPLPWPNSLAAPLSVSIMSTHSWCYLYVHYSTSVTTINIHSTFTEANWFVSLILSLSYLWVKGAVYTWRVQCFQSQTGAAVSRCHSTRWKMKQLSCCVDLNSHGQNPAGHELWDCTSYCSLPL